MYTNCTYISPTKFLPFHVSGLPREPLLEMLGEYYLTFLHKRGYGEILRNLGHNVLEFLQNLDSVHALVKRDYPDMVAPSFRCDADSSSDRMVLHYYSRRKGLHPIIKGTHIFTTTLEDILAELCICCLGIHFPFSEKKKNFHLYVNIFMLTLVHVYKH